MMTKQELIDATKNVAWITCDAPLYECFTRLRETISSRSADDKHQLNAENVTGVWYLSSFVNEEAPNAQLLVRSRLETGSYERLLLSSEICKMVGNDDEYDFDAEYLRDGSMLKGTQEQLYDAFLQGKVFAIYDSERSDAK